jgi:DNA-binding beta-propeller fold protein YncE
MSANLKRAGLWALASILCVAAIAWSVWSGDKETVLAQQDNWSTSEAERLGVRLMETRDPSGPPAYPANPGDLLFFTNSSTFYGGKNSKNSVVVINAKTKAPIAISDLDPKYSAKLGSHGIGMSLDARYIYLPSMTSIGSALYSDPEYVLVLDARTLKIYQIIVTGGVPHHAKAFRDSSGRSLVLIEHFNWNTAASAGKGFFVVDPKDNNKVIAGMSTGDLHGNPYSGFTTPDGKFLYYSVPAPNRGELSSAVNGWLAKIDTTTWQVVQSIAMDHNPVWTAFSNDGRWAWVTNAIDSNVIKVERGQKDGQRDKVAARIPTGGGPYGLRVNWDGTEVWIADKGESQPMAGRTITIIDTRTDKVLETVKTDCLRSDHIILSPDGSEMWAMCNESHEVVVLDAKSRSIKNRIPMPNSGDVHGGIFVAYSRSGNGTSGETVSDQNGLHGSALAASLKGTRWVPPAQ